MALHDAGSPSRQSCNRVAYSSVQRDVRGTDRIAMLLKATCLRLLHSRLQLNVERIHVGETVLLTEYKIVRIA